MRVGLVLLLIINTETSNVSSSGLSILLLHNRLQGSPLGQFLLVRGLELAALCLITPGDQLPQALPFFLQCVLCRFIIILGIFLSNKYLSFTGAAGEFQFESSQN